ncbi:hypothetical protein F5141DRAFT_998807, partial [Pisolithus sp. B1]
VPDEAVDQCTTSYKAADSKKQKAAMDSFNDTGIMALICCHDIPLFFANINTLGEQQKYSVGLIEHLFSLIPFKANVVILYDIGSSLSMISSDPISPPTYGLLLLRCTLMDMSGHANLSITLESSKAWACQMHQHCIWLINWHTTSVAKDMVNDLDDWLRCWLKKGIQEQGSIAQEILDQCELDVSELQEQCYPSTHIYTPACLKKELDTVLTLQTKLNSSERALQSVQAIIERGPASQSTLDTLASLECGHERLLHKVDSLYSSLHVHDRFPELSSVSFKFVQTLLLAQDLKINICK